MKNIDISIDPEDVLSEIDISDVIEYYGIDEVLSEISENDIVKYYGTEDLLGLMDFEEIKEYVENNS